MIMTYGLMNLAAVHLTPYRFVCVVLRRPLDLRFEKPFSEKALSRNENINSFLQALLLLAATTGIEQRSSDRRKKNSSAV